MHSRQLQTDGAEWRGTAAVPDIRHVAPAYQQQVDQAIKDAKTAAISNAAAQGLPTDPTKNTALQATLTQIDNQRPQVISQVVTQLFTSGESGQCRCDGCWAVRTALSGAGEQ